MGNIFLLENGTEIRASVVDLDDPSFKALPTLREMGGGKFESLAFKVGVPGFRLSRMLKNAYLRRCSHPSSLQRTSKYASLLRISSALHLGIFEHPLEKKLFRKLGGCSLE
jgi:hypothetical protein